MNRPQVILEWRQQMHVRLNTVISIIAIALCWQVATAEALAFSGLQEQLKQHYKPAKIALDARGVLRPNSGSAVLVQQPGIPSVPDIDASFLDVCPSIFRGGDVHLTPGPFCEDLAHRSKNTLYVAERAYVTSILVNSGADRVSVSLATCESCVAGKTAIINRSLLIFEFPKGYLAKAEGDEVVRTMERVLATENSLDSAGSKVPSKGSGTDPGVSPSARQEFAPTVHKGQSPEQVVGVLGKPDAVVELGTKLIYSYRNLRIVFVAERLSDVQ